MLCLKKTSPTVHLAYPSIDVVLYIVDLILHETRKCKMIQSRTHTCNELTIANVGEKVTLVGMII